jgi:hypothetical protein
MLLQIMSFSFNYDIIYLWLNFYLLNYNKYKIGNNV